MSSVTLALFILVPIAFFIFGYIVGRLDRLSNYPAGFVFSPQEKSPFSSMNKGKKHISIDDSKFVVDVDDKFSKSNDQELGVKTMTQDDITSAKNKLAQLKRGK